MTDSRTTTPGQAHNLDVLNEVVYRHANCGMHDFRVCFPLEARARATPLTAPASIAEPTPAPKCSQRISTQNPLVASGWNWGVCTRCLPRQEK